MKRIVILSLLCLFSVLVSAYQLSDRLEQAQSGDYLVTCFRRNFTLMLIRERTPSGFIIEEVTIPARARRSYRGNWREWLAAGAPGHTAWLTYPLSLPNGEMGRGYSFNQKCWIQLNGENQLLPTLMRLPLTPLSPKQRRRVGPLPGFNQPDDRPLWSPPVHVDGQAINHLPFDVYQAKWPKDGSRLSERELTLYFPAESSDLLPGHFPYWIESRPALGESSIRVTDAGRSLSSPQPRIFQNQ